MEKRFAAENLDAEKQAVADRMNLDESAVPPWSIPPIVSKTAEEFLRTERPRLLRQFADLIYGEIPPPPDEMSINVMEEAPAFGGLATRREIAIRCAQRGVARTLNLLLYIPNKCAGRAPVFFGLNFKGNHATSNDAGVRFHPFERYPTLFNSPRYTDNRLEADQRGATAYRFCFEACLKRGYACATMCYWDIHPDHPYGFKDSILRMFFDEAAWNSPTRPCGAISAWAWGVSRALDALERQPEIDPRRMAVHGLSRLGKTALWAGANDPRVVLAISCCSGTCGAKLAHRYYGEYFAWIDLWNPHWTVPAFRQFVGHDAALPIDQHQLLACIAPRPALVASATEDDYADPKGEFLATVAAGGAYRLFGMEGPGGTELPPAGEPVGCEMGYYLREGGHECLPENWNAFLDFADARLKNR